MPRGKKKVNPAPTVEDFKEVAEILFCGHRDIHAQVVSLPCILPKDHKGNHSNGGYEWSNEAGQPNAKEKVSGH